MDVHGFPIPRNRQGCPRCRLPRGFCLCDALRTVRHDTPLRVMAHVREYTKSTNTAYYLPLVMTDARIHLRGVHAMGAVPDDALRVPGREALCLVADDEAELLDGILLAALAAPPSLVLLDGNWHQVRRMARRERALDGIRRVRLPPGAPSRWRVRKAPHPEALSSFEAVVRALGIIEGPSVAGPLDEIFDVVASRWLRVRSGQWGGFSRRLR